MKKIKSSEIINIIDRIKKTGADFYTNYFLNPLDEEVFALGNESALAFLQPEADFYRIYFAASELSSLDSLFGSIVTDDKKTYLEFIARNAVPKDLESMILKHFSADAVYSKLYKTYLPQSTSIKPENIVDINLIFELMYSTFNINYDHLVSKDELTSLKDNIITIYENNELKGFIIHRIKGNSVYLNHIANFGSKQNLIDLWDKFYQTLDYLGLNYIYLWYDMQNKKAENMYNIEKFSPLNTFNYIYKSL